MDENSSDTLTGANSVSVESEVTTIAQDPLTGALTLAQTDSSNILEVSGQGIVSVPTTTAEIQVGIEVEGATASQVQQEIAQLSSAVVEQLNQLEVDELQTVRISLRPNIDFSQDQRTVVGFIGTNILQFEVPTEQAGATVDAAIQAGANIIQNIRFTAPEAELEQARREAIELAIQDAQDQADTVFNSLDLQSLEIVDIDILGVNNPVPRSALAFSAATFDASTPIIGGDQDVVANVALDINYASL